LKTARRFNYASWYWNSDLGLGGNNVHRSCAGFWDLSLTGGGLAGGFLAVAVEFVTLLIAYVLASAVGMVNQWQRAIGCTW
jgi:hypothetical protein